MDTLTVDLRLGDCLDLLRAMPDKSVDLVFTSPPYEAARTYGIGFNLRGKLGSKLAHENEAPFPEKLAEFFVRSCCPPGGIVLDPFLGSGTTAAVAVRHDRNAIGMEVRASQLSICRRRLGLRG